MRTKLHTLATAAMLLAISLAEAADCPAHRMILEKDGQVFTVTGWATRIEAGTTSKAIPDSEALGSASSRARSRV